MGVGGKAPPGTMPKPGQRPGEGDFPPPPPGSELMDQSYQAYQRPPGKVSFR